MVPENRLLNRSWVLSPERYLKLFSDSRKDEFSPLELGEFLLNDRLDIEYRRIFSVDCYDGLLITKYTDISTLKSWNLLEAQTLNSFGPKNPVVSPEGIGCGTAYPRKQVTVLKLCVVAQPIVLNEYLQRRLGGGGTESGTTMQRASENFVLVYQAFRVLT